MDVQIHVKSLLVMSERDTANVLLRGVDLNALIAEFTPEQVLDALTSNDHYEAIVKYVEDNPDDE